MSTAPGRPGLHAPDRTPLPFSARSAAVSAGTRRRNSAWSAPSTGRHTTSISTVYTPRDVRAGSRIRSSVQQVYFLLRSCAIARRRAAAQPVQDVRGVCLDQHRHYYVAATASEVLDRSCRCRCRDQSFGQLDTPAGPVTSLGMRRETAPTVGPRSMVHRSCVGAAGLARNGGCWLGTEGAVSASRS